MSQIDSLPIVAPSTDGVRPELPAGGETGGNAVFTQLLHSACCTSAPTSATDSPSPDAAALAELFRQATAPDGKDLPPPIAESLAGMTGTSDADKLPDTVTPGVVATTPATAAPALMAPSMPPVPVTPTEANVPAPAMADAIDRTVKAAIEPGTKHAPAALPQGVEIRQQPEGNFDAPAIDAARQQPFGDDRQYAAASLLAPVEPMTVERLARAPISVDTPVSLQAPVDTVRQLATAMPDAASRMPSPAAASVPVPPDHPQWGQTFGERVVWLVNQHATSAQLSLNPPDLGRLDVQINLEQDQARVLFATPHESVREAIEAAVPRLREMLADSGVQLLDVGIERHAGGRQPHPFPAPTPTPGRADAAAAPAAETPAARPGVAVGLVDYFI